MENLESLERKVALLQRFNDTAKAHAKAIEGLRDTIVERVDELRQFDQSFLADLLCGTADLSQDGPSDSGEHPRMEQGASCADGTLPVLESLEDLVEYGRSLGAPSKLKPNLAAGDTEKTLLPDSTDLETSDDLDETLKPNMVVGATEPSASWSDSTEQRASDKLNKARKPDMAVRGTNDTELDDTLTALENAGDLFHRDSEELRKLLRKFKKGCIPESAENPVKQCTKYWMKLVETLQNSCSTERNAKARQKRLSAEWTLEDSSFKETMLSLRDRGRDQLERQRQSLRQQKQLKEELKQDIKILDELARELEDRNLEAIDEIQKKHVRAKTSAAKECQRLTSEVQDLQESLQVWDIKARDTLMSYSARSADERPPAYTGDSAMYRNEILQAALDSLVEIQSQTSDAGISEVANKLAVAEAAVNSAKSFVESDPVSQALEAANSLDALLEQDKLFGVLKTKVAGRTFEEWLPEIVQLLSERPHQENVSKK